MKNIIIHTKQVEIDNEIITNEKEEAVKKNQFLQTELIQKSNKINELTSTINIINNSYNRIIKRKEHTIDNLSRDLKRTK